MMMIIILISYDGGCTTINIIIILITFSFPGATRLKWKNCQVKTDDQFQGRGFKEI